MGASLGLALLRVVVLGIFSPREAVLSAGEERVRIVAQDDSLRVQQEKQGDAERTLLALRLPLQGRSPTGVLVRLQHRGQEVSRRFEGAILVRARAGVLQLVNEVEEERYVASVLTAEGREARALPAAAQALAVTIRSFAAWAHRHPRHAQAGADLCDLTHCQWYRGEEADSWASVAARATANQVLADQGVAVPAYFTSTCGGATASAADIWGGPSSRHLRSQPCAECKRSAMNRWEAEISLSELQDALQVQHLIPERCALRGLEVGATGEGGWVTRLRARCAGPASLPSDFGGESLRLAVGRRLGWERLPSTNFILTSAGTSLRFVGRGRGHGVGLCLYGAVRRAQAGWSAARILQGYFSGTSLQNAAR